MSGRFRMENWRGYISTGIEWMILSDIYRLFLPPYGGKKGHMHWFYVSLMIQQFVCLLIGGAIGFWEGGTTLWYLVTLPMAPIIIFFYQMIIHSWIRNHGPRDVEYLVVECQIWLALCLSSMATIFWTIGYVIPHIPTLTPTNLLNLATAGSTNTGEITKTHIVTAKEYTYAVTANPATAIIQSKGAGTVTVTIKYIKVTLTGGTPNNITANPNKGVTVDSNKSVNAIVEAAVEDENSGVPKKYNVTITIDGVTVGTEKVTGADVKIRSVYLALDHTGAITVTAAAGQGGSVPATVLGYAYTAKKGHYINTITGATNWNEDWDGEKCLYAAYYKTNTDPALLKLHVIGNTLKTKYYGKDNGNTWYVIDANKFNDKLNGMITSGSFTPLFPQQDDLPRFKSDKMSRECTSKIPLCSPVSQEIHHAPPPLFILS